MTNYSMDLRLWTTIRRYIYLHGQPFLDLLLAVDDENEFTDYQKRYVNFDEEFGKHFTYEAFSRSQLGSHFPMVALGFRQMNGSICAPEYVIVLNFAFQTISPRDCRDEGEIEVMNTPEGILRYKSALEETFLDILCQATNVISELGDDGLPVRYRVGEVRHTPLNQSNEIQFGTSTYQAWIKTKC